MLGRQHGSEEYITEYCPPPNKSITIRAMLLAAFAKGKSIIRNPLKCDDTSVAISCIKSLGAIVEEKESHIEIIGGNLHNPEKPLYCGSSGAVARLLCGLLCGSGITAELRGSSQLSRRPMDRITNPLRLMGADILGDSLPLTIHPSNLHGIDYDTKIASAQVKTAILFAGLNADGRTTVHEPFQSRDHGEILLQMCGADILRKEQYTFIRRSILRPYNISVPGDFSSSAFFIAGSQLSGRKIHIRETGLNPTRLGMIRILERSGADIDIAYTESKNEPCGDIVYRPKTLKPLYVNAEEVPSLIDEIPIMAVISATISGESVFCGIDELKVKESDRINATINLVRAMGRDARYSDGTLYVNGMAAGKLRTVPCVYDTMRDHRMEMSATVATIACPNLQIDSMDCVSKSYPDFLDDFNRAFKQKGRT